MKSRIYLPFLLFAAFTLMVGLACSVDLFGNGGSGAPASEAPVSPETSSSEEEVVSSEEEEEVVSSEEEEVAEPSSEALDFYREEFDGDLGNYSYFEFHEYFGNASADDSLVPSNDNGYLIFDINSKNKWVYVTYDPYEYEDVRLDLSSDNRGVNTQQVSLICRMGDEGWYEFAVQSDGLWVLYAVSMTNSGPQFNLMVNGGSTAIRMGKAVNEYSMICEGDQISFYINGVEPKGSPHTDRKYVLRRGLAGFAVSSLEETPVKIEVDYFQLSQP